MFSFEGEGGRRDGAFWVRFVPGHGSDSAGMGGGVRTGELPLGSDSESAWKNLLSCEVLPTADNGGEGISGGLELSSSCPFA